VLPGDIDWDLDLLPAEVDDKPADRKRPKKGASKSNNKKGKSPSSDTGKNKKKPRPRRPIGVSKSYKVNKSRRDRRSEEKAMAGKAGGQPDEEAIEAEVVDRAGTGGRVRAQPERVPYKSASLAVAQQNEADIDQEFDDDQNDERVEAFPSVNRARFPASVTAFANCVTDWALRQACCAVCGMQLPVSATSVLRAPALGGSAFITTYALDPEPDSSNLQPVSPHSDVLNVAADVAQPEFQHESKAHDDLPETPPLLPDEIRDAMLEHLQNDSPSAAFLPPEESIYVESEPHWTDGLALARAGMDVARRVINVCSDCADELCNKSRPVFALANGLCQGRVPPELSDLTWAEARLIAIRRVSASMLHLAGREVVSKRKRTRHMKVSFTHCYELSTVPVAEGTRDGRAAGYC
jgi:hypothetical protein